ncbi:MAG TPA: glycosyltransferase family 39 protein [Patescibacteria group bacterium]|nr:glycosyltransferase family 39 protein [Patescibacteria group bacterium]
MFNTYLSFSDAAKFADVAKNIVLGKGFGSDFTFFGGNIFNYLELKLFPVAGILPVTPFSIALSYKIFGVNDFAVIAVSLFYFFLALVFVYLLSKNIFKSRLVGLLSTLAVGLNYDLIHYAINGASESPLVFETVAAAYFISIKNKWGTVVVAALFVMMYFTRPQAFIYILGLILFWLLTNFRTKLALIYFGVVAIFALLLDYFVLDPLSGKYFLYSVIARGGNSLTQYLPGQAVSDALRRPPISVATAELIKKVFYNLYNFYKLMPQIVNPYLFTLFIVALFRWGKNNLQNAFKTTSLFIFMSALLVAASSIPFFRYIHPVVPFIYIVAVGTLVELISNFPTPKFTSKRTFLAVASLFLITVFSVGQTLGIIFLDSRFERNTHNIGKPPVYVMLSEALRENTTPEQIIVTNLDTWGTWYGGRKTVWFPLEPKQIINPATGEIPFDAIYLTSYLIDDENYYMGAGWRLMFYDPGNPKKWACDGCQKIAEEFELKMVYEISSEESYQREGTRAVLFVKK